MFIKTHLNYLSMEVYLGGTNKKKTIFLKKAQCHRFSDGI